MTSGAISDYEQLSSTVRELSERDWSRSAHTKGWPSSSPGHSNSHIFRCLCYFWHLICNVFPFRRRGAFIFVSSKRSVYEYLAWLFFKKKKSRCKFESTNPCNTFSSSAVYCLFFIGLCGTVANPQHDGSINKSLHLSLKGKRIKDIHKTWVNTECVI